MHTLARLDQYLAEFADPAMRAGAGVELRAGLSNSMATRSPASSSDRVEMSGLARRVAFTQWGPFDVATDGHSISDVRPLGSDPHPSPIGRSLVDFDQARVTSPAVRRSWLEDGPGAATGRRGREAFVDVGWDEAIRLVSDELDRVRTEHGNDAIFGGSYGWASAGRFHHAQSQIHRFLATVGGYVRSVNTYSLAAAEVIVPHIVGLSFWDLQSAHTSLSVVAGHTELVVSMGGMPAKNAQVQSGGHGRHVTESWLRSAREGGTRFVCVSPVRDDMSRELDAEWVRIRPNTDTALLLGMIRELDRKGLADHDFLDRYCIGWDRLAGYVAGSDDGIERNARWASAITDVAATRIEALAEEMANARTMINASWSLQRADHGEMAHWSTIALAATLGQIGLPGGGFGLGYGAVGSVGNGAVRRPPPSLGRRPNAVHAFIPVARIADMLLGPGESFEYDGGAYTYPHIRMIYWCGGNPFHHHQDLNRLVEAWQRPETVVVHEPYWTSTARHADIVLPATTPYERNDLGGASDDDHLFFMEQIVEPVGDARDDYWIFTQLADRLGVGHAFSEDRTADEWVEHLYQRFAGRYDDVPDFAAFRAMGHLRHEPRTDADGRLTLLADFRADPLANALATPSGKIELWSETVASFGDPDCPGHPAWVEPYEWLGEADADELHLISNQPKTRLHSQLDFGVTSRESKVAGREPVRISPFDAASRSIVTGDVVRIFNIRGACLAGAVVDDGVMAGVVVLSTGAWFDPDLEGTCRHGNPNVLTADRPTSRVGQGPTAQTCLVRLAKVEVDVDRPDPHRPPEIAPAV